MSRARASNRETWTTIDGVEMELEEMEDTHLFNALAFAVRRRSQALRLFPRLSRAYDPKIEALLQECQRRECLIGIEVQGNKLVLRESDRLTIRDVTEALEREDK